jgi:putative ABC transport system permease protein
MKGISFKTQVLIALRNIAKNRRRSLLTVSSVAIGFLALSLFEGYFTYVYRTLEDQAVIGERLGHITITKRGFYEKGMQDPRKYAFDAAEFDKAATLIKSSDAVQLISPRLSVSGLVSNGHISRIYMGDSISPGDITALRGERYADLPGRLPPGDMYYGVFGSKLAQYLDARTGSELTMIGSTIDGMVNAIDVTVGEITNTGSASTDDKSLLMPLALARKLTVFDGADRIVVLFRSKDLIPAATADLHAKLGAAGFDVEIKEWKELSQYYSQVKGLFDIMYLFLMIVVAIVVMASVANTLGMSIAERTREIGTLRALGMTRSAVGRLFVIEGVTMVMLGSLIGVIATYLAGAGINGANITYIPPDSSVEAELMVELLGENLFGSVFTLAVLAIIVSYLPARRASYKQIVEALSHV